MIPDRYGSFLEPRIFWYPVSGDPPNAPKVYAVLAVLSTPPGMAPERWLEPLVQDALKRGARPTRVFSGGQSDASPYPTAFTEPAQEGHGGPLPRRAVRAGADLRRLHDLGTLSPEGFRDLRLLDRSP